MLYINYLDFLKVTNISESSFKKRTKKEKIKALEVKGYIVSNIDGIGIKAVFCCEATEELQARLDLKDVLGIDVKYPIVMNEYLKLLCSDNVNFYLSSSDSEITNILFNRFNLKFNTLKNYLFRCRKDLELCGWMKPIVKDRKDKNATKRRFVIRSKITGETKDISSDEFIDNYRDIYYPEAFRLKNKIIEVQNVSGLTKGQQNTIRSLAREKLEDTINGHMYFVYKKEFKIGGFNNLDNS